MEEPAASTGPPPHWSDFEARLALLCDPHTVRGAQLEYVETLLPCANVEYTPRELSPLAGAPRLILDTGPQRMEGLPFRGDSAILDDMLLVCAPSGNFSQVHLCWLKRIRALTLTHLRRVDALPPDPDEHPVTRLGREPLFHRCVQALSSESQMVFHGLFLSIDGFGRRFPERSPEGDTFLREVAALLRDTHPPRTALFHLSHAFFAALTTGPARRQYRPMVWGLRNLMLRRGFLPHKALNISGGVIFWPTDACFPGPFCDLLLSSLNKARRKRGHSVVFTEDWYRNPFAR